MLLDLKVVARDAFGVTPDTRFLYLSRSHQEALNQLFDGIDGDRSFMVLTGAPGTGKTTLLFHLLEHYRNTAQTVFLFQTQCTARELMRYVLADCDSCDIDSVVDDVPAMHEEFNRVLVSTYRTGRRFLLLLDEAQNFPQETLEAVRLLSDFETPKKKLLQIVFSGQRSLEEVLASPTMVQLRQRVCVYCSLEALTPDETSAYIAHRLKVIGKFEKVFSPTSVQMIFALTRGVPREIHNVCFESLCLAQSRGAPQVNCQIVSESAIRLRMPLPAGSYEEEDKVCAATASASFSAPWQDLVATSAPASSFVDIGLRAPAPAFAPVREAPSSPEAKTTFAPIASTPSDAHLHGAEEPPADPDIERFRYLFEPAKERPVEKRTAPETRQSRKRQGILVASGCAMLLSALVVFAGWGDAAGLKSKLLSVAEARVETPKPEAQTLITGVSAPQQAAPLAKQTSNPAGKPISKEPSPGIPEIAADPSGRTLEPPAGESDATAASLNVSRLPLRDQATQLPPAVLEPITKARLNAPAKPAISEIVPSKLMVSPPPVYPEEARRAGVFGVVELDAVIDTQGRVKDIRVNKGHPLLIRAAIKAAERQQYTPYLLNAVPQEVPTRIRFVFKP